MLYEVITADDDDGGRAQVKQEHGTDQRDDDEFLDELPVITSYSIHYTKLYEEREQDAGRDRDAERVVAEREQQVLPDIGHRRVAQAARRRDASVV